MGDQRVEGGCDASLVVNGRRIADEHNVDNLPLILKITTHYARKSPVQNNVVQR